MGGWVWQVREPESRPRSAVLGGISEPGEGEKLGSFREESAGSFDRSVRHIRPRRVQFIVRGRTDASAWCLARADRMRFMGTHRCAGSVSSLAMLIAGVVVGAGMARPAAGQFVTNPNGLMDAWFDTREPYLPLNFALQVDGTREWVCPCGCSPSCRFQLLC